MYLDCVLRFAANFLQLSNKQIKTGIAFNQCEQHQSVNLVITLSILEIAGHCDCPLILYCSVCCECSIMIFSGFRIMSSTEN